MKKNFNEMTTIDAPMDSSFTPKVERVQDNKPNKKKIIARGKQKTLPSAFGSGEVSSKKTKSRTQKEIEQLSDLEKMNEENIKAYRFKARRNRVVIITLVVLLLIAISSIAVYLTIVNLKTNCKFYVHGAHADFYIDDEKLDEFRAPSNIQGNARLEATIELKIKDSGKYRIKFYAKCYIKNKLMDNTLIYLPDESFEEVYDKQDNLLYCESTKSFSGKEKVLLCEGVIFDYKYQDSLNVDNFRMEFHVELEKV